MTTVNIFEAKTNLSRLIAAVETGAETEIIIARNGRPVARLAPLEPKTNRVRLGLAKGKFVAPREDPELDRRIAELFYGSDDSPE
ncbi:MAG TPA: type II toxin-antitoxin system prevent-host-death family antitoxin [Caulobacteraceae bacterium]